MTQLQKIVAKAKLLRKSNPNTKWTDLIKKASKLVTPAKKSVSGIKRNVVKKSAPSIPLIKKRIVSKSDFAMAGVKKKKATKKAVKKSPLKSMHKDTKSHNVNIRVMSGTDDILKDYLKTKELLIKIEKAIRNTPILAQKYGYTKAQTKIALNKLKKYKKETSEHLTQLKKLI
jgi:hypothetical protein